MNVQAKFKCLGINYAAAYNTTGAIAAEVRLVPVWEENGKNRQWSQATPNGELRMTITNMSAVEAFDLGQDYILTFEKAEEAEAPKPSAFTDEVIKTMVDRFLSWKLPDNFSPDGGISFNKVSNKGTPHAYRHEPVGTNLLTATQATEMVRHMLAGLI